MPEYQCAECGDDYTSIRAALVCEAADVEDDKRSIRYFKSTN